MRSSDERGAIAVTVAVFFTAILGVAAVVMDGGAIRDEHAQLQNGVDSAALSLAKKCAYGYTQWCDSARSIAEGHVDEIAEDGTARIVTAQVDKSARTVRLVAGSETKSKPNLPMRFAAVFGKPTVDARAEAIAKWNPLVTRPWNSVPMSRCVYDEVTKKGTKWNTYVKHDYTYSTSRKCADNRPATVPAGLIEEHAPEFPSSYGNDDGDLVTEIKCNNKSVCDPDNFADDLNKEIILSVWSKDGPVWSLDGFVGFKLESMSRNGGHQVGTVCDKQHDCISGWFTRTQNVGGVPGYYRLGGEVWLIK